MKTKKPRKAIKKRAFPKPAVNTAHIRRLLEEKGIGLRELGRKLGLDPSSVFNTIEGKRRIQSQEAAELSSILGISLVETLTHFGIDLRDPGGTGGWGEKIPTLKLEGFLDGALVLRSRRAPGQGVPYPFGHSKDVHGARFETAGSPFSFCDGGLVFWKEPKGGPGTRGADPELIGRAAMVRTAAGGELKLRELRRGYTPGRYHLAGLNGQVLEEDALVLESYPVLMIKFG